MAYTEAGKFNTRIALKHDTEANWIKAKNFIPLEGEIIIYDADENYSYQRIKIGDGTTKVKDLPFVGVDIVDVTELPNPNMTAKCIADGSEAAQIDVHCVEKLPEVGLPGYDYESSKENYYYNLADSTSYYYVTEEEASDYEEPLTVGWHTLEELCSIWGRPYGGVINNVTDAVEADTCYILLIPPTGEINEALTYRVLDGTFVHNMMLQNHCVCHTIEWANGPEGIGEPVLSFPDNALGVVVTGYYNITNNTIYGYFDDITIEELGYYIDSLDLDDLVKLALKAALKTTSKGWKTLEEVVDLVGSATSMSWGGIIADITEATNNDGLYLLLSSKYYYHRNNKWITTDNGIGMPGQFAGAEIFNDPHNIARGKASHAEGRETVADSDAAHAEGYRTQALAKMSHAEGEETEAQGQDAHAEGYKTHAIGQASHAEGTTTWATGAHAHAEGYETKATGSASHAGGIRTEATGDAQTVIGRNNFVDSTKAFIIGNGASASARSNAVTVDWNGNVEFKGTVKSNGNTLATETYVDDKIAKVDLTDYATKIDVNAAFNNNYIRTGWDTVNYENGIYFATGTYATIEGHNNRALGIAAHAEGEGVWANGHYTHAEGYGTKAIGDFAHVEGVSSVASGQVSHAEGTATTASGTYSHSQGESTVASGHASHAEGKGTIAAGTVQHVQGFYNIEDTDGNYLHIVGNGSNTNNRSNAHTLDWNGNAWFAGEVSAASIKIGNTKFTETQLLKILNFIETIEIGGNN